MKHYLLMIFMVITLSALTACDDDSGHAPTEIIDPDNPDDDKDDTGDDKEDDEDDTTPGDPAIAECEATANPISEFVRIESYYGALQGQAHIAGETGGLLPLTLTEPAAEGDLTLPTLTPVLVW